MERFEDIVYRGEYFIKITKEDTKKIKKWLRFRIGKTDNEKKFLKLVKKAIKDVNYEYEIAIEKPSVNDEYEKIYYEKGSVIEGGFSCKQWKKMAKKYAPEKGSRLANLNELLILYALLIVNGSLNLEYVSNNSQKDENIFQIVTIENSYAMVYLHYNKELSDFSIVKISYPMIGTRLVSTYGVGVLVLTQ